MRFWRWVRSVAATALVLAVVHGGAMAQGVAYLQDHDPWGSTTNQAELTTVFGGGGWTQNTYAVDPTALFADNCFIIMEGGETNDAALAAFLAANQAAVTAWVMGGGSLYIQAAGWFTSPDYSFLGATYNHNGYDGGAPTGASANALHPIFNGPYTPTGLAWSGNYFSHAYFTGMPNYTTMIVDGLGRPIVIETSMGAGHIILSGRTTSNWHSPNAQAVNLNMNLLQYGADLANCNAVPEPGPIALLLGSGIVGSAFLRRRRSR